MAGSAKATIDHDEIRAWVEERGGCPARVKSSGRGGDPGILRIDYTGFSGKDSLEKIPWDEFFEWFDKNELAFLHQDKTASGKVSRFSKLVSRESVDVEEPARPREPREQIEAPTVRRDGAGDPMQLIVDQHEQVRRLFGRLVGGELSVAPDLLNMVGMHLALEEAVVYPPLFESDIDEQIRESIVEHASAKRLIADLIDAPVADDAWWAAARVLRRQLEEHMEREESEILPILKRMMNDEEMATMMQDIETFTAETNQIGADAALEVALSNMDARLEQQ